METRASGFVVPSAHCTMPHAIHADEAPENKQGGFAREPLIRGLELEQDDKGVPMGGDLKSGPDFDAKLPALCYARVIGIPTPRWSTDDAVHCPDDVPVSIRERAWISPVWHTS